MTTKTALPAATREAILGAPALPTEDVDVPEWGVSVTVRALSGTARDKYEADLVRLGPAGNIVGYNLEGRRARMLALAVVGPDGKPLFKASDILSLGDQNADAIDRVVSVALRISGMSDDTVEALSAGLKAVPPATSGSDSPETSG